jgi:plastocyanin domain-containing protein
MRKVIFAVVLTVAFPALAGDAPTTPSASSEAGRKVLIKVTEDGFRPREVKLKKGEPTTLVFTRVTENTCITAVDIPAENVKELDLPLNKTASVTITPQKSGVEKFHCSAMGMGDGKLIVGE